MIRNKEWLIDLDSNIKKHIRFVDNSIIVLEGFGRVQLKSKNEKTSYLNDA